MTAQTIGVRVGDVSDPTSLATVSIERDPDRIRALEQPGDEPTIVLTHGYPENHVLYDRLLSLLTDRHAVCDVVG